MTFFYHQINSDLGNFIFILNSSGTRVENDEKITRKMRYCFIPSSPWNSKGLYHYFQSRGCTLSIAKGLFSVTTFVYHDSGHNSAD